jgi:hypothetical protein
MRRAGFVRMMMGELIFEYKSTEHQKFFFELIAADLQTQVFTVTGAVDPNDFSRSGFESGMFKKNILDFTLFVSNFCNKRHSNYLRKTVNL